MHRSIRPSARRAASQVLALGTAALLGLVSACSAGPVEPVGVRVAPGHVVRDAAPGDSTTLPAPPDSSRSGGGYIDPRI